MGWCLRSLAGPRDDTVMGEHGGRARGIGDTGPHPPLILREPQHERPHPPSYFDGASATADPPRSDVPSATARAAPPWDGFSIGVGNDGYGEGGGECKVQGNHKRLRLGGRGAGLGVGFGVEDGVEDGLGGRVGVQGGGLYLLD